MLTNEDVYKKCCKDCKIIKNITEFSKCNGYRDGHRSKCRDCIKEQRKIYNKSENGRNKRRAYAIKRRANILYKLHHTVRNNITNSLRRNRQNKNGKSIKSFLPYTIKELKIHLETLWEPWMNWQNYGKADVNRRTWQIDHIIPTSLLPYDSMNHPNFLKCWDLKNLRPLESIQNINKRNNLIGDLI